MIIILGWKNSVCGVHILLYRVLFKSYKEEIEGGK